MKNVFGNQRVFPPIVSQMAFFREKTGVFNPKNTCLLILNLVYYISNGEAREHSSAGRASALQAEGHRFEPYCSHQCLAIAQCVREWLSGRASPCQGECREFESRFPLHFFYYGVFLIRLCWRRHRQAVRPGSAKPLPPVRIWVAPPLKTPLRLWGFSFRKS